MRNVREINPEGKGKAFEGVVNKWTGNKSRRQEKAFGKRSVKEKDAGRIYSSVVGAGKDFYVKEFYPYFILLLQILDK